MSLAYLDFYSNTVPVSTPGSNIVFERLARIFISKGYTVRVFSYDPLRLSLSSNAVFWEHIQIPLRLRFTLPVRTWLPFSAFVRRRQLSRYLLSRYYNSSDHYSFVTMPWDQQSLLACDVSQALDRPFHLIIHDDEITFCSDFLSRLAAKLKRRLLVEKAKYIFPVSMQLLKQVPSAFHLKCFLLPPIAERYHATNLGYVTPTDGDDDFRTRPMFDLGYAGKVYPPMFDEIRKLLCCFQRNHLSLVIISDVSREQIDPNNHFHDVLNIRPLFASPEEAFHYLRTNTRVAWVCSPQHLCGRWRILNTSFPSKLVELAINGFPFIITSAPGTPLHDWGLSNVPEYTFSGDFYAELATFLKSLTLDQHEVMANRVLSLGNQHFDPLEIGESFFLRVHDCS
jgi:hypothetical protein